MGIPKPGDHGTNQRGHGQPDQRQVIVELQESRAKELRLMRLGIKQLVAFENEAPGQDQRRDDGQAGQVHLGAGGPFFSLAGRNSMFQEIQQSHRCGQYDRSDQHFPLNQLENGV